MVSQEKIWDKLYIENENLWNRETSSLPAIIKGKSVLELGAGNGKTLNSIIKQKPKSITAIDISKEAIRILNKQYPQVKSIKSDVIHLPFKDNSFEIIVCYYILNNLDERERKKAVNEIRRVLKKDGKVLFEDFNVNDFRQKEGNTTETNTIVKSNKLIHHFFTKSELKELFSKFSHIKVKEKSFSPFRNKKHIQRKLISALITK